MQQAYQARKKTIFNTYIQYVKELTENKQSQVY